MVSLVGSDYAEPTPGSGQDAAPGELRPALSFRVPRGWFATLAFARESGGWAYNVDGLTAWKRKWRAEELEVTYCAVRNDTPWREVLGALALMVAGGKICAASDLTPGAGPRIRPLPAAAEPSTTTSSSSAAITRRRQ